MSLHLQEYNLNKEDIVMLCVNNQKNACIPLIAGLFVGVLVAALDPLFSILEVTHFLKEAPPKVLFVIAEVLETIEASLRKSGRKTVRTLQKSKYIK